MKIVNVTSGPTNEVIVMADDGPQSVMVGSSAFGGIYPDIPLLVVTPGQTRWNIGGQEFRRTLYLNGLRQRIGLDYTVTLPYLDWIGPASIETDDLLILTVS